MTPPLINKQTVGDGVIHYTVRTRFKYRELLTHLPEEMLKAKEQLGNSIECYALFWTNYTGKLYCEPARGAKRFVWSLTYKRWMEESND